MMESESVAAFVRRCSVTQYVGSDCELAELRLCGLLPLICSVVGCSSACGNVIACPKKNDGW